MRVLSMDTQFNLWLMHLRKHDSTSPIYYFIPVLLIPSSGSLTFLNDLIVKYMPDQVTENGEKWKWKGGVI